MYLYGLSGYKQIKNELKELRSLYKQDYSYKDKEVSFSVKRKKLEIRRKKLFDLWDFKIDDDIKKQLFSLNYIPDDKILRLILMSQHNYERILRLIKELGGRNAIQKGKDS